MRTGFGTIAACTLLATLPVAAHGPAPAPLRVLAADDGRPTVVVTNIGIAVARPDGNFDYVCPAHWGDVETPLTADVDGTTWFVVGSDDVYRTDSGGCSFAGWGVGDDIDPRAAQGIASDGELAVAAVNLDGGAGYVLTDVAGTIDPVLIGLQTDQSVDGVIGSPYGFLITSARPVLRIHRIEGGSEELLEPNPIQSSPLQRLVPRFAEPEFGGAVYFVAVTDGGVELWRSDDGGETLFHVLSGNLSIHGPVPWCGGMIALVDGEVMADPERPPGCDLDVLAGRQFNCLTHADGYSFACELRALYALEEAGPALAWELDQLVGPNACAQGLCDQNWLHFGAEAGLVDVENFDAGGDASSDVPGLDNGARGGATSNDGCACASHRPVATALQWWFSRR